MAKRQEPKHKKPAEMLQDLRDGYQEAVGEGFPEAQRYLEKVYRRELALAGTPVRLEFRTGENPYADRRNQLTQRQVQRKRRLMAHVKKQKKRKK